MHTPRATDLLGVSAALSDRPTFLCFHLFPAGSRTVALFLTVVCASSIVNRVSSVQFSLVYFFFSFSFRLRVGSLNWFPGFFCFFSCSVCHDDFGVFCLWWGDGYNLACLLLFTFFTFFSFTVFASSSLRRHVEYGDRIRPAAGFHH